jgi:hypothetical protein
MYYEPTGREDAKNLTEDEEEGGLWETNKGQLGSSQSVAWRPRLYSSHLRVKMKELDTHPC